MPQKIVPMFDDENALDADNFFKKLKLHQEFGMQKIESNMTPKAESQWLDYIMEFEQKFDNAKKIKLYDFIQRPAFRLSKDLSEQEISEQLQVLIDILDKNFISLDILGSQPDRKIYDFIVNELFEHEIEDVRIEGMYACFIYEDFHPDHAADLQQQAYEYVQHILGKNKILTESKVYDDIFETQKGVFLDKQTVIKHILDFQNTYQNYFLKFFDTNQISFDLEKKEAFVRFQIGYMCDQNYFEGEARLFFVHQLGFWYVCGIDLPNFKLGRIQ